jgi:hypothetical protein
MEHVVFYPAATGVPAFRRVSSLDEAINFVEQLRNSENITDFSVYELAPVQLSFRAYYHVQVPGAAAQETAEVVGSADEPVNEPADEPAPADAVENDAEPVAEVEAPVEEPAAEADVSELVEEPAAEAEVSELVEEPVAELGEQPEPAVEPAPEMPDAELAPVEATEGADEVSEDAVAAAEPTMAPVEADDDRSAEWVAEAVVVEAPVEEPVAALVPEVIGLAADEPVLAVVPPFADPVIAADESVGEGAQVGAEEPVADGEPATVAAVPQGPFADAPPVTSAAPVAEPAAEADTVFEPGTADVVPAVAPSGRRSLGFFAR